MKGEAIWENQALFAFYSLGILPLDWITNNTSFINISEN